MTRHPFLERKFSLHSLREDLIDVSMTLLLLSVSGAVVAGMLLMMLFSSCSTGDGGKKKAYRQMAEESLLLMADRPESVRVIALSEPDSVFGKSFFTDAELESILDNINGMNESLFHGVLADMDFDDPKVESRMQRAAALSDVARFMMTADTAPGEFSGWKVKALYQCADQFGDTIKNERYFIFDRDMRYIIHSFEIPIL